MIVVEIEHRRRALWSVSVNDPDAGAILKVWGTSRGDAVASAIEMLAPVNLGGDVICLDLASLRRAMRALAEAVRKG